MADDALELVRTRNNFYRDNYRRALIVLLLSMLLNFGVGAVALYLFTNEPEPVYFATNVDGTLLEMIPLGQPYVSNDQLLSWATQAALSAYSYNFLDYQSNLQQARKYFTAEGFDNYLKALETSGNLETVKEQKLVVKAVVADVPVILTEGRIGNRYAWKVQIPMIVRYVGSKEWKQPVLVTMLIGRVSTLQSSKGIAIAQFVVQDRKDEDLRR